VEKDIPQIESSQVEPENIPSSKDDEWITMALLQEYKKWHATPYRLGGLGENGIDCSSLIQQIYKDAFGIVLPRTAQSQAEKGRQVSKESIKAGDLIFFKTGANERHAGIVIEEGKFIHSSQKYGVIISQLSNPYWKNTYWQSRRVLPE